MNNELFTQIVGIFISLIGTLLAYYIVPILKAKLGQANYSNALSWATVAVKAAEQIINESGQGARKKQYVLDFLKTNKINLTAQELDAIIEAAVLELNKAVR